MQFYGNFFIHGWPYYPDGTDVGEGFSGGCIRLSTSDAKEVFEFADIHTPIYVFDSDAVAENELEQAENQKVLKKVNAPHVSARSYLVADLETGEVFLERNSSLVYPIASITKLLTAVVANETISFDRLITVTPHAFNTYGGQGNLQIGERLTIGEMYYPLLLSSSNDAAVAIASHQGEGAFITLMNQKARALDMENTIFDDPSGLSPQNVSTASDLFKLARYIHDRKSFIFEITTKNAEALDATEYTPARTYTSNNPMRGRGDFLGGKNGFTDEARKTLLSLFKVGVGDEERVVAIIVLGSEDHTSDTLKLLSWIQQSI
jgi:D-alanyl-D-alanine carboxypeptidase